MSQSRGRNAKSTILVVDDDRGTVELMEMMLKVRGYDVLVAYSGMEAIALVEDRLDRHASWASLPVDLILLDIMMPGIDGFKVCQYVKDDPFLKYIPVIMVTALENTSDKVAAVEFGADGYITKPFLPEELGASIKAKLQIKARQEELLRRNRELEAINAVSAAAISTLDPRRVLEESFVALMDHAHLGGAAIFRYDEAEESLQLVIQQGVSRPDTIRLQDTLSGEVVRTQRLLLREALSSDPDWQTVMVGSDQMESFLGVPLRGVERSLGLLELYQHHAYFFQNWDLAMYGTIGDRIGIALENAQIFQRTQSLLVRSSTLGINKE